MHKENDVIGGNGTDADDDADYDADDDADDDADADATKRVL